MCGPLSRWHKKERATPRPDRVKEEEPGDEERVTMTEGVDGGEHEGKVVDRSEKCSDAEQRQIHKEM